MYNITASEVRQIELNRIKDELKQQKILQHFNGVLPDQKTLKEMFENQIDSILDNEIKNIETTLKRLNYNQNDVVYYLDINDEKIIVKYTIEYKNLSHLFKDAYSYILVDVIPERTKFFI